MRPRSKPQPPRRRGPLHRINELIREPEIRLVGEEDPEMNGVYQTQKAIRMALDRELDLVEISNTGDLPICRIIEYSRFLYEQKKKQKEQKKKQHVVEVKEIRFGPNIDEHDFNFKLRHAEKFLKEGNKIKAFVHFYGRTIVHNQRGRDILDDFAEKLNELAKIEQEPKLEGRRMIMFLAPKK